MVVEQETLDFWQWFLGQSSFAEGALVWFVVVCACLALAALVVGYLLAAVRHGPMKAGDLTYQTVVTGVRDLRGVSARRVLALSRLAVKESFRRRVLVAVIVYLVVLLFAGWFLGTDYTEPAKLYLSFVLTATTYLVVMMALFLSAFSLPGDISNKTIHTVVTKPVRAAEIVMGRILGFLLVGTVLLAVMGIASYVFVVQTLSHSHEIDPRTLEAEQQPDGGTRMRGRTTVASDHRHDVVIGQPGGGRALAAQQHHHEVTARANGDQTRYAVGRPQGMLVARVPVYGKLRFKDRQGNEKAKGISVGNEWTYRSYIEGGTEAAAVWTFDAIDEDRYPDGLPLEMTLSVFRTYKGKIADEETGEAVGILGGIVLRHPDHPERIRSATQFFRAREYAIDSQFIPRDLQDPQGSPLDLYEDLVEDGRLIIEIQCLDRSQYFGMAQADLYLRARDGSFLLNYVKGYVSIWMQMALVIGAAVACSTFLSGPVAMMFTLSVIVLGFFKEFILGVATGTVYGGGPMESLIRLVSQMNVTLQLEEGWGTTITRTVDAVVLLAMRALTAIIPDFRGMSSVRYVSDGFNIPFNLLSQDLLSTVAYLAGMFVIGFFFFRTREVAR